MQAILLALIHFRQTLRGSAVLMSDNMSAVACLRKQGSLASLPLMDLTLEFLEFCHSQGIVLVPNRLQLVGWT